MVTNKLWKKRREHKADGDVMNYLVLRGELYQELASWFRKWITGLFWLAA